MPFPVDTDLTFIGDETNPVSYSAPELRRATAAGFVGTGAGFEVRGGVVRHSSGALSVAVNGADTVTVSAGAVVIPGNFSAGQGAYAGALPAASSGALVARDASNARIDLVVFRALDGGANGAHSEYTGRVEILPGTPDPSPGVPALPEMAVELARISVPASGGGAATVDMSYRTYAASLGGELLVPSAARLPASAPTWQTARALDTGQEYLFNGAAWDAPDTFDHEPAYITGTQAPPVGTPLIRLISGQVISTGADGTFYVPFPTAGYFPNGMVHVSASPIGAMDGSGLAFLRVLASRCDADGFGGTCYTQSGTTYKNALAKITYDAYGW